MPLLTASLARAALFAAALALVVPAAARAQDTAAPAAGSHHHPTPQDVEGRITALHEALMITPAQDSLWNAVAQAMRDNTAKMWTLAQTRRAKHAKMTAVEDLHSFAEMSEAQADGAKKLAAAFEPLYAAMSAAQKKEADDVFRHPRRMRGGGAPAKQ
jgi:hypothetical protein